VKKNKYNNKKTKVDDITFDSKMEADYYCYLKIEQEHGRVETIELQPAYEIIPRFIRKGLTIRKTVYKADFLVTYSDGTRAIIDVKGVKTPVFKLKQKLFLYHYPELDLHLVKKSGKNWVEI
jgi:hypothetical protein